MTGRPLLARHADRCSSASAPGRTRLEYAVYLSDTAKKYTLARYRADDIYAQSGHASLSHARRGRRRTRAAARADAAAAAGGGAPVLLSADGSSVFYQGTIYDKNPTEVGPKTFIDKVAIKTGEKTRIYESDNNDVFERVSTMIDPDAKKFVVAHESPTTCRRTSWSTAATRKQLTKNEDIAPDLTPRPSRALRGRAAGRLQVPREA